MHRLCFGVTRASQPKLFPSPGRSLTETQHAMSSLQQLHAYAVQAITCRPAVLLRYFGEDLQRPCQVCDVCLAGTEAREWRDVTSEVVEALAAAAVGGEHLQTWSYAKCKRQNAPASQAAAQLKESPSGANAHEMGGASEPSKAMCASKEGQRTYLFWRGLRASCVSLHSFSSFVDHATIQGSPAISSLSASFILHRKLPFSACRARQVAV
jgi:hypothetical protein